MSIFCSQCGHEISKSVLDSRKYGHKKPRNIFCNVDCDVAWRKEQGFYARISHQGKEARSKAVSLSNHEQPRRRK